VEALVGAAPDRLPDCSFIALHAKKFGAESVTVWHAVFYEKSWLRTGQLTAAVKTQCGSPDII